ncbi:hypothetical protein [Bradyrhizobium sp. Tv2a-2]|uniref:hypothetical protein n=1 Tax=Bradyrhizobium sp. Tv2a-2 TaxID=113395 RepID=UPI0004633F02|nr:hypothetical protein [Bradyrhizobium sp. Tv2a-2]
MRTKIETITPADQTRRNILTVLGSAAAVAAIPAPGSALHAAEPDPIFAAIETHKRAMAAYDELVDQQEGLEAAIPQERQRTTSPSKIVESDDPRWIAFQREMGRVGDAESDAECALASVVPTSVAGILALLEHAIKIEEGVGFRDNIVDDEGDPEVEQNWYYFANRNIVAALRAICA